VRERLGRHAANRFADGDRVHRAIGLNPPVQFAKEGPAVAIVVFPGVLAVEATGEHGPAVVVNALRKSCAASMPDRSVCDRGRSS